MTPFVGLAAVALAWGPNHAVLDRVLGRSDALERTLVPIERVIAGTGPLWIVEHDQADLDPMYVSAEAWNGSATRAATAWLAGSDRLLPELEVPRLLVGRRHYATDRLALDPLAVDVYEPLVRALIEAQIASRLGSDADFAEQAAERAAERMADVAAGLRRDAFLGGVVEFSAQAVAVAHEIARQERRRLDRGDDGLCALLGHPATLFGHWRRLLTEAEFHGYAPADATASGSDSASASPWLVRSRRTRTPLSTDDKRWAVETLLGRPWTGDPEVDFAILCER